MVMSCPSTTSTVPPVVPLAGAALVDHNAEEKQRTDAAHSRAAVAEQEINTITTAAPEPVPDEKADNKFDFPPGSASASSL